MLEVRNLEVGYGDLKIVRGISFEVRAGSLDCLLGTSSAGKTTTMLAISGILVTQKGEIIFNDEKINNKKPREIVKRGIVHIPEGRKLFSNLTVMENLEIGSVIGEAKRKRKTNLEKVFFFFPKLKERSSQRAGTLSGGEQQMLAIGRGIMSMPVLLTLDEPSQGLAPMIVDFVFDTIVDIKNSGVTVLLVEQHVYTSLKISDKAFIMENGVITLAGPSKSLLNLEVVRKSYFSI